MTHRILYLIIFVSLFFYTTSALQAGDKYEILLENIKKEGSTVSRNNRMVFFKNGAEKFDDIFKAIRQAKSSIHMEYFNFRDDSIANTLFASHIFHCIHLE